MATIKDVAKRAGVSVATVSRVLNKKGPLSEKSIVKVNEAVKELHYTPNLLARSLASGKKSLIGVVLPSFNTPIWSETAQMIASCAREIGYNVVFYYMPFNSDNRFEAVEYLRDRQVSGVIFCGSMWKDQLLKEKLRHLKNLPLVVVIDKVEGVPCIVSDDGGGGSAAARLLISKGCKHLAHVSSDLSIYKHSDERTIAFLRECEKAGVSCRRYENGKAIPVLEDTAALMDRILQEEPLTDGLFVKNDMLAAQCVSYAIRHDIKIPDRIRIIGYDDMRFSHVMYPSMTTLRHDYRRLAQTAIQSILDQVEGKAVEPFTVIPVELIERETT